MFFKKIMLIFFQLQYTVFPETSFFLLFMYLLRGPVGFDSYIHFKRLFCVIYACVYICFETAVVIVMTYIAFNMLKPIECVFRFPFRKFNLIGPQNLLRSIPTRRTRRSFDNEPSTIN